MEVGECSGSKELEVELEELNATLVLIVDTAPSIEFWLEHAAIRDCLDFLGVHFGFQKDNVRNQREHVVFLLANSHSRFSTLSALNSTPTVRINTYTSTSKGFYFISWIVRVRCLAPKGLV